MKIQRTDLFGTTAAVVVVSADIDVTTAVAAPARSPSGMRWSSAARCALGGLGLVLILSGCAFGGWGGQSKESAEAGLLSIPGVSAASVDTNSLQSGFAVETSTAIKITLEPGYSAPDPVALADFLLSAAWSTNTKKVNWAVRLDVVSDPQISILDAADEGQTRTGFKDDPGHTSVRAAEVRDRFGAWPGDVPEVPDGLIIGPTPEPTP
jgi:hypothetical protein